MTTVYWISIEIYSNVRPYVDWRGFFFRCCFFENEIVSTTTWCFYSLAIDYCRQNVTNCCVSAKMYRKKTRNATKQKYLLVVNVWSHQSALQRNAFKSSAVRPTITTGGATIVRTSKPMPTQRQMIPNRFNSVASVILTALAERTRNTTEILLAPITNGIWKKKTKRKFTCHFSKKQKQKNGKFKYDEEKIYSTTDI